MIIPCTSYLNLHFRQESPLEAWVLLNTDGASKGNLGIVASGGVIHGAQGE